MKLIVMGTGPFAVPTLVWLKESEHEICLVVTRPIEDAGKRRKSIANPVRELAESWGDVPVIYPANVNDGEVVKQLASLKADLMFVCDFGQILKNATLSTTRLGGINLHGSLLPKYRGAAPINWAILEGEKETGVTVIHMTPRLDGGPAIAQSKLDIGDNETAEQLEPRMAQLGVKAVHDSIVKLSEWDGESSIGEVQDRAAVTRAPRLEKKQGALDWSASAKRLFNQIRAFQPWPGSFTHWMPAQGKPVRLIVHKASVFSDVHVDATPGAVVEVSDQGISIATSQGCLTIHQLQPAGKRPMEVAEFLRGRKVEVGDCFGNPG